MTAFCTLSTGYMYISATERERTKGTPGNQTNTLDIIVLAHCWATPILIHTAPGYPEKWIIIPHLLCEKYRFQSYLLLLLLLSLFLYMYVYNIIDCMYSSFHWARLSFVVTVICNQDNALFISFFFLSSTDFSLDMFRLPAAYIYNIVCGLLFFLLFYVDL